VVLFVRVCETVKHAVECRRGGDMCVGVSVREWQAGC